MMPWWIVLGRRSLPRIAQVEAAAAQKRGPENDPWAAYPAQRQPASQKRARGQTVAPSHPEDPLHHLHGARLLLVEDNQVNQEMTRRC
jgi:hypothetical protein